MSGLNWAPGQYLVLRWSNSTNTAGMAIDDFQIDGIGTPPPTPTPTPTPTPVWDLLGYALGLDPHVPASAAEHEVVRLVRNPSGPNEIRLRIPEQRDDILYIIQVSEDLETWTTLASAEGRAAFSAAEDIGHPLSIGNEGEEVVLGGFEDGEPPAAFYRLKVELR